MKYLTASLAAFGLLFYGAFAALAEDGPAPKIEPLSVHEMNELVESSNFIVRVGSRGICSGTLISTEYRLILTAHHCIDFAIRQVEKEVAIDGEVKKKKIEVTDDVTVEQPHYDGARQVGKSTYQAKIVGYDKDHDLGLLQIRSDAIPNKQAVKILSDKYGTVERGDKVWSFGNPLGLENSVSFGHVASTRRLFHLRNGTEVTFYQTDAGMLTFGNSGGALLKGKYLIGVPALTVPGTPVSLSIPYTLVQKMLTRYGYEDVWNDDPAMTHAEWVEKQEREKKTEDLSVKELLQKLVDKKAEPTGSPDGYLFEDGEPMYYLRAFTPEEYHRAMERGRACAGADDFAACISAGPPAKEPAPAAGPKQSLLQRIFDAFTVPQ